MERRLAFIVAVATLSAFAGAAPVRAADRAKVLTGYAVATWSEKDGLPSPLVYAVAQDRDGYLWVATDGGLVRFDGVRFTATDLITRTPLRGGPVRALLVSRDGALWVGHGGDGGVSRVADDGEVQHFGVESGLPKAIVTTLFEDSAGAIWTGSDRGLFRLEARRWTRVEELPDTLVNTMYLDRRASLYVGTAAGAFVRPAGKPDFERVDGAGGPVRGLAEDSTGTLWSSDPLVGVRKLQGPAVPSPISDARGSRLLYDTQGHLWVSTRGQGLFRLRGARWNDPRALEQSNALTGLSNDGIENLFEDREGNIWVATVDGLNRLTPHKVSQIIDVGIVSAVDAAPDGGMWVGTADALIRFPDGDPSGPRELHEFAGGPLAAMHVDSDGVVWAATGSGLLRLDRGTRAAIDLGRDPPRQIAAIASDARGAVWLYDLDRGVLRVRNGALAAVPLPDDLRAVRVNVLHGDHAGRMWLALADERVAIVAHTGSPEVFGASHGLTAGVYRAVHETQDGVVWLGGTNGLTRFADGRFTTLQQIRRLPAASITAIKEEAAAEFLWLALESSGAVRIARSELEKAFADPAHEFRFTYYDRSDGFAGSPHFTGSSTVARGADGRLWFVSGRGLTIADPAVLRRTAIRPGPVRIERATADGQRIDVSSAGALRPGTSRLDIEYTALNLTSPLRTRFRYRLAGFDAGWIDAGTRRQAFYTNLPPRSYEFQVLASSDDGAWGERQAAWRFTIQRAFYQTAWFAVAAIAGLAVAVGGAWRLHVRRVRRQFALLLGERARVSREIHDTLLQSMVGVALQFDVLANDPEVTSPRAREQLVRMRRDMEEYIREARQSIWDLRSPRLQKKGLVEALREAAGHVVTGSGGRFDLEVSGGPRRCAARVEEQLLRIGQEAAANAVRHGRASAVRIDLDYADSRVRLRVVDNGSGFDPAQVAASPDGHYGLISMRERAEDVGGMLRVESAIGQGTTVEAEVPIRAEG